MDPRLTELIAELDGRADYNREAFGDTARDLAGDTAQDWAADAVVLPEPAALVARAREGARLAELVNTTRYAYLEAENAATGVRKGATLRVVRGRKVPIGTTGRCIWVGETRFGERVGLADAAGTVHWTAFDNVTVDVDGDTAADLYALRAAHVAAEAALAAWVGRAPRPLPIDVRPSGADR